MPESTESTTKILPTADFSQGSKYVPPEAGIGQRIKELRTRLNISVEALSILIAKYDYDAPSGTTKGISVPSLYRYEKGERIPGGKEIRLLCVALRTMPNWLLTGNEQDSKAAADAEIADLARKLFSLIRDTSNTNYSEAWPNIEHTLKLDEAKIEANDISKENKR